MDTRKRLEKVLTTALGQSFEECPNAKKVVIQETLHIRLVVRAAPVGGIMTGILYLAMVMNFGL